MAGNTVIPCGMSVPVAVWQPCELLYTCYLLLTLDLIRFDRIQIQFHPDLDSLANRTVWIRERGRL